jgi:hypothetical protein
MKRSSFFEKLAVLPGLAFLAPGLGALAPTLAPLETSFATIAPEDEDIALISGPIDEEGAINLMRSGYTRWATIHPGGEMSVIRPLTDVIAAGGMP